MPESSGQNLANHARVQAPFLYVVVPAVTVNLGFAIANLWNSPSWQTANGLLLAVGLLVMAMLTRVNPLKAQDRVIRLEEHLRYDRVLAPDLAARAKHGLTEGQVVALRFASDGELADLAQRVLGGSLKTQKEIKAAVKSWRSDHFRV
ncbi:MAG: hypothetical protein IT162_03640 [Bryobacterales bacterium]|nr:hypothetical protein [Bryobacterales bacterium]